MTRPNHLAGQTSPYLLQHLYNPVDWYAWGPQALERARREDRPIFLSIGYAACHWCHVMERESFENVEIAEILNRHFVPIKVDREERPDIDEIYMNAVQVMTGQGGWPLSCFLKPNLEPFLGGTYYPPEDRHGRIGFPRLLQTVHRAWTERRGEIDSTAKELTEQLRQIAAGPSVALAKEAGAGERVGRTEWQRGVAELVRRFEPRWGGFSQAPKFPPDGAIALLLREHLRRGEAVPLKLAETTLDRMALGGMYDHIGGGFARYSVDERWLVPHFEKMLYNQALLVPNYLDGWLITGKPLYRRVVEQTLDFVRRELTDANGGFYSSLDADSEGEEGKFYVWSPDELDEVLGSDEAGFVAQVYGITPDGNFEGKSIPNLLGDSLAARAESLELTEQQLIDRLEPSRLKLLDARAARIRPGTDDKILTAWNGLMLTAFSRAYQTLGRAEDLTSAERAAAFLESALLRNGRLRVSFRQGQAPLNAYLDDYAFLARGLLDLYEAGFDSRHLLWAERLAETLLARFENRSNGGFYFTSDDHESLLARHHSLHDGALPAGAGVAAELLLRLAVHLRREDFRASAERTLEAILPFVRRMPSAYASLLLAADLAVDPAQEIAILGAPGDVSTRELLSVVRGRYRGCPVVQVAGPPVEDKRLALLHGKQQIDGRPTAYVCRDYSCRQPTTDPGELARQLDDDSRPR